MGVGLVWVTRKMGSLGMLLGMRPTLMKNLTRDGRFCVRIRGEVDESVFGRCMGRLSVRCKIGSGSSLGVLCVSHLSLFR